MAPESHGEKKGWSGLFYPPNGLNFQFCWFNLIFLIAPSWSESNFILSLFFYSIRVGPSRSELIRPGLAVQVDPVRPLYLPLYKGIFFNVSCVFKVKCGYTVMCKYKKECLIKILKSAFCNFQELPFGYWKTFSHLWSCLKPAVFLLLFVCTKTFSKHVYINLYV